MSKLRDSSIALGSMPQGLPVVPHVRPAKMAAPTEVPRDGGMLASGASGGNFDLGTMTSLPNNSGPRATQDVADDVGEAFGHPVTSIL